MLSHIPRLRRAENFRGGGRGELCAVGPEDRLRLMDAQQPLPAAPVLRPHSRPPAPPPLQTRELRASYIKQKWCRVTAGLESEPGGQKDP